MFGVVRLEFMRNINRSSIAGLLIFVIIAIAVNQVGMSKYKQELQSQKEFVDVETRKIERYVNYVQYGGYGFRRLLESSPLNALFCNSTTFEELHAFIDNGVRLKFSKPESGKHLFDRATGGTLDFSWYLLVMGGILAGGWGFLSYLNKEYLRFLMVFTSPGKVYGGILLGRTLLIILCLGLTFLASLIQFLINGIVLTGPELGGLLVFDGVSILVLVFLLVLSSALGMASNGVTGGIMVFTAIFFLVWLWPEVLSVISFNRATANMKSRYRHEVQKLEKLMEFEKMALAHARDNRYKTDDDKLQSDKELAESWWDNEFKTIEALEFEMLEQTQQNVTAFYFHSIFSPVTFYKSVNNELSSRGYNSYLNFYKENQKIQKAFLRFYLNKRYHEKYKKIVPYLSPNQYLLEVRPGVPGYFLFGLLLNLFYVAGVVWLGYLRFKRWIFSRRERVTAFDGFELALKRGNYITLNVYDEEFTGQLLNVLWGKPRGLDGRITLDGEAITTGQRLNFVYLPHPRKLPGWLKTGTFLNILRGFPGVSAEQAGTLIQDLEPEILNKRLQELDALDRNRLLLGIGTLKKFNIYILDNFMAKFPDFRKEQLMDQLSELKGPNVLVIDLIAEGGVNVAPDFYAAVFKENSRYKKLIFTDYYGH